MSIFLVAVVAAASTPATAPAAAGGKTHAQRRVVQAKKRKALARKRRARAGRRRALVRKKRALARLARQRRLFAANSIWRTPMPASTALDPTSGRRVAALARTVADTIATKNLYPNIQADTYSTPIYRVPAGTPRVPVRLHTDPSGRSLTSVVGAGVPIPAGASPAAGTDGHMTIYQAATDTLWEFWRARKAADGWHASWGGAMRNVSRNPGYYTSQAWSGLLPRDGWNWGSTASSLPVAGGTVTIDELRAGRIDHALAVSLADPCRAVFSWPAQRTDGRSTSADCIPEGARLRLDPSINLATLHLPPVTKMLARAAQRYGMIVRDRTGGSVAFYLESPERGRPSPYTGRGGLYKGVPPWRMLERFPWRSLRMLPLSQCTSAPCVRR